jgi:hypothetical protein
MTLNGPHAEAELMGNLFVALTSQQSTENAPLAGAERRDPRGCLYRLAI